MVPVFMALLLSCSPSAKPINYGSDMCHYCKMTIVDAQHAAQLVTAKGKVTNFDAIECMLNHLGSQEDINLAFKLVNDFSKPKTLIDAETSYYLISKAIPSPMGAYLSAFATYEEAHRVQKQKGGEVYSWHDIQRFVSADISIDY